MQLDVKNADIWQNGHTGASASQSIFIRYPIVMESQTWQSLNFGKRLGEGTVLISGEIRPFCNKQMILNHRCPVRALWQTHAVVIFASWFWADSELSEHPVLWMVDHTSPTTCRYLPGFYTSIKLHSLGKKAQRCVELDYGC